MAQVPWGVGAGPYSAVLHATPSTNPMNEPVNINGYHGNALSATESETNVVRHFLEDTAVSNEEMFR